QRRLDLVLEPAHAAADPAPRALGLRLAGGPLAFALGVVLQRLLLVGGLVLERAVFGVHGLLLALNVFADLAARLDGLDAGLALEALLPPAVRVTPLLPQLLDLGPCLPRGAVFGAIGIGMGGRHALGQLASLARDGGVALFLRGLQPGALLVETRPGLGPDTR